MPLHRNPHLDPRRQNRFGADAAAPAGDMTPPDKFDMSKMSTTSKVLSIAGLASIPLLAYHGYKRDSSVGWALVWGIFGSMVWPVTVPVAFVQGFGKKA